MYLATQIMDKIEKNRPEHKLLTGVCQGQRSSQTGLLTSFPSPFICSHLFFISIIHESSYEKVINGRSGFSTHNLAPHRLPCRLIRGSCRPFPIINHWSGKLLFQESLASSEYVSSSVALGLYRTRHIVSLDGPLEMSFLVKRLSTF